MSLQKASYRSFLHAQFAMGSFTDDRAKNAKHMSGRNLPLSQVADFQWDGASFKEDGRASTTRAQIRSAWPS